MVNRNLYNTKYISCVSDEINNDDESYISDIDYDINPDDISDLYNNKLYTDLLDTPNNYNKISNDLLNLSDKSIAIKWIYLQSKDISNGICNAIYTLIIFLNLAASTYLIWADELREPIHKDLGIIVIACINIFIILILFMLKSTYSEIETYNKYIYEWQYFNELLNINNNIFVMVSKYNLLIKNNRINPQSIKLFKREFINSDEYLGLIHNKESIISSVLDDLVIE